MYKIFVNTPLVKKKIEKKTTFTIAVRNKRCMFVQPNRNSNSMQNTKSKSETKTKTKTLKRVIAGNGTYNDHPIILLTILNENKEPMSMFISKSEDEAMEVFDAFGDKINELQKQGYEIEYRFNQPTIEINNQ
jgi:hypothetical protein